MARYPIVRSNQKGKKKTYKRRQLAWYNRRYSAKDLAIKAIRNVGYIKGLVNSEMLHTQGTNTVAPNSSTGVIVGLNLIAQGDTSSGRTGNSILMRNLMIRIAYANHTSAANTFYRVMVVCDTQQIGDTAPVITDILESTPYYLSPLATATSGRFKVLMSKVFTTNNLSRTNGQFEKFFTFYMHARYNGVNSSDIQKNGLWLVIVSDQGTNTPNVVYQYKLGYHDN